MTEKQHKPGSIMRDDPLAWLTEAPGENPFEQVALSEPVVKPEPAPAPVPTPVAAAVEADVSAAENTAARDSDEGEAWGLFEAPDTAERRVEAEAETSSSNDAGDGWGLFEAGGEAAAASPGASQTEEGWGLFDAAPAVASGGAVLSLGSALLLQDVDAARSEWLALVAGGAFEIDATEVERVDTAGMQLLCALALSERQQGRDLCWQGVSPPLSGAAVDLGVSKLLGLAA